MAQDPVTPNQVVAFNLRRARELHGWTQDEAAGRLEPYLSQRWSKASFSIAERSFDHPDRIRQFTADDLLAFAAAFGLPVSFFLIPPRDVEVIAARGAQKGLSAEQMIELAIAPQDDRVQELIEDRLRGVYRLAYSRSEPDTRAHERTRSRHAEQRAAERATASALREGQKAAGLAALRQGDVVRGQTEPQKPMDKRKENR
jgi:transcriptional regulator with XRE-family HTH domain